MDFSVGVFETFHLRLHPPLPSAHTHTHTRERGRERERVGEGERERERERDTVEASLSFYRIAKVFPSKFPTLL